MIGFFCRRCVLTTLTRILIRGSDAKVEVKSPSLDRANHFLFGRAEILPTDPQEIW
jgi:hypothetical protein